jgi:hypothetical protein
MDICHFYLSPVFLKSISMRSAVSIAAEVRSGQDPMLKQTFNMTTTTSAFLAFFMNESFSCYLLIQNSYTDARPWHPAIGD